MAHIDGQMLAAHRYGNKLRELERNRRAAVRIAQRTVCPDLDDLIAQEAALDEQIHVLLAGIKARRQKERAGSASTKEERATKAALAERLKMVRLRIKEAKVTLKSSRKMRALYRLIDRYSRQGRKMARAAAGCYWGTYLQVEEAIEAARKAPGDGPRFARWTGDGKIAVQIQGGLSFEEATGCDDTRLRVEVLTGDEWLARQGKMRKGPTRTPGSRRDQGARAVRYAIVWMRAGSVGREPLWVQIPVQIDREIPPGKIMWAWLLRRQSPTPGYGAGWRWEVQIVIRNDAPSAGQHAGHGTVAVNMGWRKVEDGLRVAYWVDDEGAEGSVVVPSDLLGQLDKANELRGLRDNLFDAVRAKVAAWMDSVVTLPEAMAYARRWMPQWRDKGKLRRLLALWQEQRQEGDDAIVADLAEWARQDQHLAAWEEGARDNAYSRRADLFCCVAKSLAQRYRRVLIEDFDLRETAQAPKTEDGTKGQGKELREQQRRAAPSEFRNRLKATCTREGTVVVVGAAQHNTQRCAECGHMGEWDAAAAIWHTCDGCGRRWDQDANNCRNQLARDRERPGDVIADPVEKTPTGSRRFKGARKGAAKSAGVASP